MVCGLHRRWVGKKVFGVHEKENGQWELRGLMKHDEQDDMERLVPMRKGFIRGTNSTFERLPTTTRQS